MKISRHPDSNLVTVVSLKHLTVTLQNNLKTGVIILRPQSGFPCSPYL